MAERKGTQNMKMQKMMLSVGLFILRLSILILVAAGIYKLGEYAYFYGYSIVSDAPMDTEPGRDVSVNYTEDMGAEELSKLLERKGLIHDADIFRIQLKINKYEEKLKPGEYTLNTSMTVREIMKAMTGSGEDGEEE